MAAELRGLAFRVDPAAGGWYQSACQPRGEQQCNLRGRRVGTPALRGVLGRIARLEVDQRILEKKFGPIPGWVDERLSQATVPEIEELVVRLLDTASLDELLKPQPPQPKKRK